MPLKIELLEDKQNGLLHRREVIIQIDHPEGSTPTRIVVRNQIAAQLTVDTNRVLVISLNTKAGTRTTLGRIHVYESPEYAQRLEPKYIHLRNNPKEKTEE